MKLKSILQIVIGMAIAGVGMWVFARQVNLHDMAAEVAKVPLWKLAVVAALNPLTLLLRAWRWKYLLAERPGSSKKGFFPLVTIGFMVNNFFPARIGEAARAALLWKRNGFTIAQSVGSLVVERFLDVLVFAVFLFLPIVILPQLASLRVYGIMLGAGICFVLLCFAAYANMPDKMRAIGSKLLVVIPLRFRSKVALISAELASNLDWLFSPKKTAMVAFLSVITLLCQIGMLQVLGLGIAGFDVLVSMFGIAFAAIGAAIPLAPGYVGTLHAMMLSGLGMAGISADKAGALAVLYHAVGYITISLLGLFYFFRLKISMKDIREGSARAGQKTS